MFHFNVATKEFAVYSVQDPALDIDKSNIDEYRKTLDDSLLAWNENEKPSIFIMKALSVRDAIEIRCLAAKIKDIDPQTDQREFFDLALKSVRSCLVSIDGKKVESEDDIIALGSVNLIYELSNYAMEFNQLPLAIRQKLANAQ